MESFLKRTWAEVDLDRLGYNYRLICEKLGAKVQMMASVKANAYGHGDVAVVKELSALGCSWFAFAELSETEKLRNEGISGNMLILGYTPPEECGRIVAGGFLQTVFSPEYAKSLSEEAHRQGVTVCCHIKVNSGMNRLGFNTAEEIKEACALPNLAFSGIYTHFAVSDEPSQDAVEFTRMQYEKFRGLVECLRQDGIVFEHVHCCNSGAALYHPEIGGDLARVGIALYGLPAVPFCTQAGECLKPVMQLKSVISMVREIGEKDAVSYGRTFVSEDKKKIAAVPIGYGDGYSRKLSNLGSMLVNGQKAPILGRVCMDQTMIDVTGMDVRQGDTVTVMGESGGAFLGADELAALLETINYEIVTCIGRRVPRVYLKNGKVVGVSQG